MPLDATLRVHQAGTAPPTPGRSPLRLILCFVALASLAVCVGAVVVQGADLLLLSFGSVLGAVVLNRLASGVARTGLPYGVCLALVVLLGFGLVAVGSLYLELRVGRELDTIGDRMREAFERFEELADDHPWIMEQLRAAPLLGDVFEGGGADPEAIPRDGVRSVFSVLSAGFAMTFGFLASLAYVVFLSLFLAVNPDVYRSGLIQLFPIRLRSWAGQVCDELCESLWRWSLGRGFAMVVTALGTGTLLGVLGVPAAWLLGCLTGVLTFIPNIGPTIALGLSALVALPQGGETVLWVFVLFCGVQLVESYVLTPLVQERQVSIPPALLILWQFVLASLAGFLGLLVATPLMVVAKTLIKRGYIERVLGDPPEQSADASGDDPDAQPSEETSEETSAEPPSEETSEEASAEPPSEETSAERPSDEPAVSSGR